jgi:hypothetical protein
MVARPKERASDSQWRVADMKTLSLVLLYLALCTACLGRPALAQNSNDARVPVLVELFTSEGCSDCPPAEKLLAQVDAAQPFTGVRAIVLEEHVTYWDQDGWRDPFSLDSMTDRQKEYQFRFGLNDIYTPQMVVDGAVQFVGSNGAALSKAMMSEAAKPKEALALSEVHWENGTATFTIHASATHGSKLVAVLAADSAHSQVGAGENKGRALSHVAVVRVMKEFNGDAADGRQLQLQSKNLDGPVRIVAFLVDHKTGHVLGVAEETVNAVSAMTPAQ